MALFLPTCDEVSRMGGALCALKVEVCTFFLSFKMQSPLTASHVAVRFLPGCVRMGLSAETTGPMAHLGNHELRQHPVHHAECVTVH